MRRVRFGGIGLAAGFLGGLLGVGGGVIMIPLQVIAARSPQLRANATSLAAIVPISAAAVIVYALAGRQPEVDLRLAALLVLGAIFGAYVGARTASRMPERQLKVAVAVVLFAIGLKSLVAPGG